MAMGEGGPELVKQLLNKTYDIKMPGVVGIYYRMYCGRQECHMPLYPLPPPQEIPPVRSFRLSHGHPDVRVFEDALTFKIAMMVADHMKYMQSYSVVRR